MYIHTILFSTGTMDRGTAGAFRTATCTSARSKSAFSGLNKYLGTWRASSTYESRFLEYSVFSPTSTGYVITA